MATETSPYRSEAMRVGPAGLRSPSGIPPLAVGAAVGVSVTLLLWLGARAEDHVQASLAARSLRTRGVAHTIEGGRWGGEVRYFYFVSPDSSTRLEGRQVVSDHRPYMGTTFDVMYLPENPSLSRIVGESKAPSALLRQHGSAWGLYVLGWLGLSWLALNRGTRRGDDPRGAVPDRGGTRTVSLLLLAGLTLGALVYGLENVFITSTASGLAGLSITLLPIAFFGWTFRAARRVR